MPIEEEKKQFKCPECGNLFDYLEVEYRGIIEYGSLDTYHEYTESEHGEPTDKTHICPECGYETDNFADFEIVTETIKKEDQVDTAEIAIETEIPTEEGMPETIIKEMPKKEVLYCWCKKCQNRYLPFGLTLPCGYVFRRPSFMEKTREQCPLCGTPNKLLILNTRKTD